MRVGLFDDPIYREHDAGPGHPEHPGRVDAARHGLEDAGLEGELALRDPRPASREELLAIHSAEHVDLVAGTKDRAHRFDPDTAAGPHSYEAALSAAGAVAGAVEEVVDGTLDRAFCVVRPPGHHATSERAMGFCLFNNVAVGAARALDLGLERVAVVDFDVHHGNGTQAIFWEEPRVLYLSSHQFPFYPGTGALDEVGEDAGRGFTLNLPLPGGLGDGDCSRIYREIVEPVGRSFDPQLVLVSAGFDAHEADPLGGMGLTAAGFAELTDVCVSLASGAANGRVVAVLEGGYSLEGLAASTAASVGRLLDHPSPALAPGADPRTESLLAAYRKVQTPFWPVLGE
jgi:acetoin utilization deacetylase AcuC-like enzyme